MRRSHPDEEVPARRRDRTTRVPVLRLRAWWSRPVVGAALVMAAAGYAQFVPTAALVDVVQRFGDAGALTPGEQAGLGATRLGVGLAIIRLSSLASLPLCGAADRIGRRPMLLGLAAAGLAIAAVSAVSPGYWFFVAAFAVSRPFLVAADTLAEVVAAEHTTTADRAKAIALVSATYGMGAGFAAIVRGATADIFGFRVRFATIGLLLIVVAVAGPMVAEPLRFRLAARDQVSWFALAAPGPHRRRLAALAAVAAATGAVSGPAITFFFLYAERDAALTPRVLALTVAAAAPVGLAALLAGRLVADRIGRRVGAMASLVGLAAAAVVTYTGTQVAAITGYLLAVAAGAAYAVPIGALVTESFTTRMRATATGSLVVAGVIGSTVGLLVFGAVSEAVGDHLSGAIAVAVPAIATASLLMLLPETRGREMEDTLILHSQG
jgi:MFS family permease